MKLILMPIIWWSLTLLAFPAFGQATPETACGEAGVGKFTGYSAPFAKTAEEAKAQRVRVAADGYWTQCTLPEDMPQKPPAHCFGNGEPRTWTVGGLTCTSALKGNARAEDPSRDRGIADGDAAMWRQWTGANRGHLIERCVAGQRVEVGRTCAVATHCDTGWAWQGYSYRGAPVPIGGHVTLTKPGGIDIRLQCAAGAVFIKVR